MRRAFFAGVALTAIILAACGGGGDKKPASPTEKPEPTTQAAEAKTSTPEKSTKAKTATPKADSPAKGEQAVSDVFGSLFGNAFSRSSSSDGLGEGDPKLLDYLPSNSDLPDGYTPLGSFTARTPDGVSDNGKMDIAAEMAMAGDPDTKDPSQIDMLMAMVIKPDDLQSLGDAFQAMKDLNQKDLEDAIAQGAGGMDAFKVKSLKVLDADGLGEGGAGIEMTIDMSALGSLFSGLGGSGSLNAMTMRMYIFGRGDYAGAVMRIAFTDGLSGDVDEMALAKIIDKKLKAAQ